MRRGVRVIGSIIHASCGRAMFAVALALTLTGVAHGHDATVVRVEAEARPGVVVLTFQLRQNDLMQAALKSKDSERFRDEDEFRDAADAIAAFVRRGIRVTQGGRAIDPAPLNNWPPDRISLYATDPDGQFSPTTIPFTLLYPTAAHDGDAEIVFMLFDATGISATYSISVWRAGAQRSELVVLPSRGALRLATIAPVATQPFTSPSSAPVSWPADDAPEWTRGPLDTFAYFLPIGFEHIVPEGLDHILFVLGLFLLSPRVRPLLAQVTAFTVAHSITLALASLGVVRLPPSVVEPVIALSIAFVAIENMLTKKPHAWRWIVVFIFGLIHGLGFAGALSDVGLPRERLVSAIVGFNVGVELGQLAVIAIAALALAWWRDRKWYRPWVSMPISGIIAAVALFWTVERIWL